MTAAKLSEFPADRHVGSPQHTEESLPFPLLNRGGIHAFQQSDFLRLPAPLPAHESARETLERGLPCSRGIEVLPVNGGIFRTEFAAPTAGAPAFSAP